MSGKMYNIPFDWFYLIFSTIFLGKRTLFLPFVKEKVSLRETVAYLTQHGCEVVGVGSVWEGGFSHLKGFEVGWLMAWGNDIDYGTNQVGNVP